MQPGSLRIFYQRKSETIFDASARVAHFELGDNAAWKPSPKAPQLNKWRVADYRKNVGRHWRGECG